MWRFVRRVQRRGPCEAGNPGPRRHCTTPWTPILRHVAACNTAVLPGDRLPFRVAGTQVGWVTPAFATRLTAQSAGLDVPAPDLPGLARALADAGAYGWRGEAFDVRAHPDGPALATIDRGALPSFGIGAVGVHLNALVERADGPWLWVARRAADKRLDPGKLDHLVAGGVPAGLSPWETLLKEANEEAGLPPDLVAAARPVGTVDYAMDRPEGLRRDRLHCYDLVLPPSFVPEARDGEVEAFELWPMQAVLDRVRGTDDFKFNVNLVLIGLFRRLGMLADV